MVKVNNVEVTSDANPNIEQATNTTYVPIQDIPEMNRECPFLVL
ncbi:hypothetical protein [Paenibacillus terrae]|nr:hypothetical protein [Paenibacillus terrae]